MKKYQPNKIDWIKGLVACALYIAFLVWIQSWWGIVVLPFIFDAYITKKINWGWWKDLEDPILRTVMSWVDAIVFALVAVYFVNIYFFQNYTIPSSSLEKSLLVGDYLFVSKMTYGPRVPQTPLHAPLCQHTLPMGLGKSYIESVQWDYKRVSPKKVTLNDIVVFNYPAGDTIAYNWQNTDYYRLCKERYVHNLEVPAGIDSMSALEQYRFYNYAIQVGSDYVKSDPARYGKVQWRPVDRRENYVKRCVGLPGQTLEIRDNIIYLDGVANKEPDEVQYNYEVTVKYSIPSEFAHSLGISKDDLSGLFLYGALTLSNEAVRYLCSNDAREYVGYVNMTDSATMVGLIKPLPSTWVDGLGIHSDEIESMKWTYIMPLTAKAKAALEARPDLVESITYHKQDETGLLYPLNGHTGWTCDNYGPIWIPAKGETIQLTMENLPIYERPIRIYEGNDLQVTDDGRILINGKETNEYTFKMDYYWMQGDNRHNSADSRYWGFVPEDHIVGKPILVWLSIDPYRSGLDAIRWNRLFHFVDNFN